MIERFEGIKREVAEVKFLIHDLRVESFINEVIHYHVTVNTDLEIYNVDQAQAIHLEDLQELKTRAVNQRKTLEEYSNAVKSFSPDTTILAAGQKYIETIYDLCELILDPRWGRISQVLTFLPPDSRSTQTHRHYWNCIRWICGVHSRIRHFLNERTDQEVAEQFDISEEIQNFVRNVVYGYVTEKSSARVDIQLDRLDSAVLEGNRYRFRRMFFNLVMNAVDAMRQRKVGVLHISDEVRGDRVVLSVRDNGTGILPAKIQQLLTDRETLDGELHSLGFVFVRQTIHAFGGSLEIDSKEGEGATVSVSFPYLAGAEPPPQRPSECEKYEKLGDLDDTRPSGRAAYAKKVATGVDERHGKCGEVIFADYMVSDAQYPGAIFAVAVNDENRIDFFTHRPYERHWSITHEDLSPMFFEATVRGRLEEDENKNPVLILKAPQNTREYFDFREIPEADRTQDRFAEMVHDEYVRIGRKLVETGMSPEIGVHLTDLAKFFREQTEPLEPEPFPLERLAKQRLTCESPR
jgi:hypothetical protein